MFFRFNRADPVILILPSGSLVGAVKENTVSLKQISKNK
jgi:hypothetical protein